VITFLVPGFYLPVLVPPNSTPGMQLLVNVPPRPPVQQPIMQYPNAYTTQQHGFYQQQGPPDFTRLLSSMPNVFAKQTTRGWCEELFCCEAQTEFKFATMAYPLNNIMYALEESTCCVRACCPRLRPWDMNVSWGSAAGGQPLYRFVRPCKLDIASCKCCCYQQVNVSSHVTKQDLGMVIETFYFCVPTFRVTPCGTTISYLTLYIQVLRKDGSHEYDIHMPTCLGGMCVNCSTIGCCGCRIPFYIFPPGSGGEKGQEVGRIVKVWSGLSNELLTQADNFEVEFPAASDEESRVRLLGALFLLNQLFFESTHGFGQSKQCDSYWKCWECLQCCCC
jgi:hypothetical protein